MKFIVLSDIHLEFGKYTLPNEGDDNTTVILAGDIHVGRNAYYFVNDLCHLFHAVVYVPGNHEFYNNDIQETNEWWETLHIPNLFYLYNKAVVIGGKKILGTTLWTDVAGGDYFAKQRVKQGMNDLRLIKGFNIELWLEEHDKAKAFLEAEIEAGCIVVTHFLPHEQCIMPRWVGNPLNGGFVCYDLDHLFDGRVTHWVYGHTHDFANFNIKGTEMICNPRGYFGYELVNDYQPFEFETEITWY